MRPTITTPLQTAGARSARTIRVVSVSLLLGGALLLQGCLAGAWVVAVAFDWGEASEVIFAPFEHSWVAQGRADREPIESMPMNSIAVVPFAGDADMGARVAAVLQQETGLRIEAATVQSPEADQSLPETITKTLGENSSVDAVLFGRVEAVRQHPSEWGWSEREPRRLYLQLIDRRGELLWSDELPYTVVKGSVPPLEERVQSDLAGRLVKEIESLHLDELGYLPKKLAS